MPNNPAGGPREDGWYWVRESGTEIWVVALWSNNHPFRGWTSGPADGLEDSNYSYIGPRIPSPDERTPDTASAPQCVKCGHTAHGGRCPVLVFHDRPGGPPGNHYCNCDCIESGAQAAAKQPDPPVSAQKLREAAGLIASLLLVLRQKYSQPFTESELAVIREQMSELEKLADWMERRHE